MYLICHVTSHCNLIDRPCKHMGGSFLHYITTLISLVTISIGMVEICFKFVVCPLVKTCLKDYVNLWVEAHHGGSQPCHDWWSLVQCKWRYNASNMSRDFTKTCGSSYWYVTTLPSLIAIGFVLFEIQLIQFVT